MDPQKIPDTIELLWGELWWLFHRRLCDPLKELGISQSDLPQATQYQATSSEKVVTRLICVRSCSFLFVFIMSCSFLAALACVILSKQENLHVIWLHISIAFPESTGSLKTSCLAHLSNFSFLLWGILKKSTSPRALHWNHSRNYPARVGPTHKMMVSAGLKPQALPFCAGNFKPLSKTCSQRTRRVDISPCQPALAKAQAKLARFNGLHLPHRKVTLSERSAYRQGWHGMASVIYLYIHEYNPTKKKQQNNATKHKNQGLDWMLHLFPTNSTLKILDSILTPQFHRSNKDDHLLPKGRSGSMASRLKT